MPGSPVAITNLFLRLSGTIFEVCREGIATMELDVLMNKGTGTEATSPKTPESNAVEPLSTNGLFIPFSAKTDPLLDGIIIFISFDVPGFNHIGAMSVKLPPRYTGKSSIYQSR